MVRPQLSSPPRRRRSPPPWQPRVVEPLVFKVAVRHVVEQRVRHLRSNFFNGRPYPRAFAKAFQAALDQASEDRGIVPGSCSGSASVDREAELAHGGGGRSTCSLEAHASASDLAGPSPPGAGADSGSARSLESPSRGAGSFSGSPALKAGNHGGLADEDGGRSLVSLESPPRRAARSSGAPALEAGNGGAFFDPPGSPRGGEGGGSTRSPRPASPFDEVNRRKNQEAVESFLADLGRRLGLLVPPPLPPSEREPTPPPPSSPPPPLPVFELTNSPPTRSLSPSPARLEIVRTPEDAHMAVAAAFAGEQVRVRVSADMQLIDAEEVKTILLQAGLGVEDTAILDAKLRQVIWLKDKIADAHGEVQRLESMLLLDWL